MRISEKISNLLDVVEQKAQAMPDGVFVLPFKSLLKVSLAIEDSIEKRSEIKKGLIEHMSAHTYAFTSRCEQPDGCQNNALSRVTRHKYLKLLECEGVIDYNMKTFNNIIDLLRKTNLKNHTITQFWWTFCRKYYLQGYAMLADVADPHQTACEMFWVQSNPPGIPVDMVKLNILRFSMVFGKMLRHADPNNQTKKKILDFLNNTNHFMNNTLCENLGDFDQKFLGRN